MRLLKWLSACVLAGLTPFASADQLYVQSPTSAGTTITSAYWDPDGSNSDEFIWDGFLLPTAGNITEVRWRGAYPGGGAGGGNITNFEVAIYSSIPAGIQPDLGGTGVLRHYETFSNCNETYAGNAGGTNWYDYSFTLPAPFLAAANTRYWIQIIAWQPTWPTWGLATASGGNGTHFARVPAAVGDFRFVYGSGDVAFSLIGTPAGCSNPTITLQPTPVTTCFNGSGASFSVAASGSGPFTYRWRLNGSPVYDGPNGGGTGGGATISGATTPTLLIQSPSYWHDVGNYDCVVSNACGNVASNTASLSVGVPPQWQYGPVGLNTNVCVDGTASLTISIWGTPTPTFTWQKSGVPVANGVSASGSIISGADGATLSIANFQAGDLGMYRCLVQNSCGLFTSNSVAIAPGVSVAPTIDVQPGSVTTGRAGSAVFSVVATAAVSYQWQIESSVSPGVWTNLVDGPLSVGGASVGMVAQTGTSSLHWTGPWVSPLSSINFRCVATNSCGSSTSASGSLSICVADVDDGTSSGLPDGGVTIDDLLYYLSIFEAGSLGADVDDGTSTGTPDGGVTIDDLLYYLFHFEAGC